MLFAKYIMIFKKFCNDDYTLILIIVYDRNDSGDGGSHYFDICFCYVDFEIYRSHNISSSIGHTFSLLEICRNPVNFQIYILKSLNLKILNELDSCIIMSYAQVKFSNVHI